jgi:hypothetical protein
LAICTTPFWGSANISLELHVDDFYVYGYFEINNFSPFYVGKGRNGRAYDFKIMRKEIHILLIN